MKKIRVVLILSLLIVNSKIGFTQLSEQVVEIIQSLSVRIHSVYSPLGRSTQVIQFQLPANTIRWYYSVSAFRDREDLQKQEAAFSLFSKLTYLVDQTGTSAIALSMIGKPPGTDYCDVFVLSSGNDVSIFEKELSSFKYNRQGSRKNLISGVVDIREQSSSSSWKYLGLRNPALKNAVNVNLQVVAIVREDPMVNGWSAPVKQQLYEKLNETMIQSFSGQVRKGDVENISACIMTHITQEFTPQEIAALAEYELKPIFVRHAERCTNELGVDFSNVVAGQVNVNPQYLLGRWKDQNSTFTIYKNKNVNVFFDNGSFKFGKWSSEGNKLEFSFNFGNQVDKYLIIELTDSKLIYRGEGGDQTIWEAVKQD